MEQKDYILREIEKISILLRYLLGKILPVKSLELYEYVNETGKTFSFEREIKISKIKNELQ
ncbi:MAG: hypothetical protein GH151_04480 [Bacteroidetes bacterium]|nr:hypothetical protein [Bacteroidota bacterium]